MRSGLGPVVGRVVTVIATLLIAGLVLRLITAVLAPVLPASAMQALTAGWRLLFGLVSPAMAAIVAVAMLGVLCWVLIGKR
jgi:hypothetical protein